MAEQGRLSEAQRIPAECWHPSVFIQKELDVRGWTRAELSARMSESGDERYMNMLAWDFYFEVGPQEPGLRIGDDAARLTAAVFGVDTEYFLNLERSWLAWVETPAGRAALAKPEQ